MLRSLICNLKKWLLGKLMCLSVCLSVCVNIVSCVQHSNTPVATAFVHVNVRSGGGIEGESKMNNIGCLKVQRSVIKMMNPNFRRK